VNDLPALRSRPLAAASLSIVQTTASAPIADHSIRTFLYARLLAEHEGSLNDAACDEDLLFAACVMHDLGLGSLATGQARFEVEGADLAATLLTEHDVAAPGVDRVWEAIALHSSVGIAHRRGLLTYLTHRGVFIGIGRDTGIPADLIQRVRTAYPHRAGERYLADAIADHGLSQSGDECVVDARLDQDARGGRAGLALVVDRCRSDMLSAVAGAFADAGFVIDRIAEPQPSQEALERYPSELAGMVGIPIFIVYRLRLAG
jgi:hypothetical protein